MNKKLFRELDVGHNMSLQLATSISDQIYLLLQFHYVRVFKINCQMYNWRL